MAEKKTYDQLMAELPQEPEVPFIQAGAGGTEAWEDLPEEYTPRITHQPGQYIVKMPQTLGALWETFEAKDAEGQPLNQYEGDKGIRVRMAFSELDCLTIVRGPSLDLEGQQFDTRIDNRARIRNYRELQQGAKPIWGSDMDYLLRALGCPVRPATGQNRQYMALFNGDPSKSLPGYAGALFAFDWEWSGWCNPSKQCQVQYPADPANGKPEPFVDGWVNPQTQQPVMGCDARTYQSDWPKIAGGKFAPRGKCVGSKKKAGCQHALLYPFGRMRNFKPAPPGLK